MRNVCFLLGFQVLMVATCLPLSATTLPKVPQSPHQFSLGVESFYYTYREPGLMRDKGFLYGANATYNYTFAQDFFLQPDVRFAYGRTNYKSNGTGSSKNTPNWLVEPRLVFGKRFNLTSITELDPYVGVGYRYKTDNHDGKRTTTGHLGYRRKSHYLYVPLGFTLRQQINCEWSLAPTVEFDWFLRGWQQSYLPGQIGKTKAVNNTQKKGYGLKGDLMLTKKFTKSSLSVGPFINYWNIKDSDPVKVKFVDGNGNIVGTGGVFEPHNKTIEVGLKVNYSF